MIDMVAIDDVFIKMHAEWGSEHRRVEVFMSKLETCPEKSKGINLSTMCFIGEHQNTRIGRHGKWKFIGWDR
jgi:hypothetical protein